MALMQVFHANDDHELHESFDLQMQGGSLNRILFSWTDEQTGPSTAIRGRTNPRIEHPPSPQPPDKQKLIPVNGKCQPSAGSDEWPATQFKIKCQASQTAPAAGGRFSLRFMTRVFRYYMLI